MRDIAKNHPHAVLCITTLIIALASLSVGPAGLGVLDVFQALIGVGAPESKIIVLEIRLPRILSAFVAGAALGASGAALQGLLRNPLADPGVLGVSSAAALGAVVAVYFGLAAITPYTTALFAIGFALLATIALFILGAGKVSTARLILVGVGISSFAGALLSLLMNIAPNPFVLSDLVNWLFGTVANRSFADLIMLAPFLAAGFVILFVQRQGLSALTLGEETAISMGADLKAVRIAMIAGAALLVGASVALAGAIGFVGVVAPHLARPIVEHSPARTIAPSALIGGVMLVGADLFIRILPFSQELKLGVAAALIGAPGFVWIAASTRRLSR